MERDIISVPGDFLGMMKTIIWLVMIQMQGRLCKEKFRNVRRKRTERKVAGKKQSGSHKMAIR